MTDTSSYPNSNNLMHFYSNNNLNPIFNCPNGNQAFFSSFTNGNKCYNFFNNAEEEKK